MTPNRPGDATELDLRDERATSPTVGAVLMVAVTVLLASAAGAQMLGLAGGQQGTFATATVDLSPAENRVSVTWLATADAEKLDVRLRVGDERRTVALGGVGERVVVDDDGVTVSADSVSHWKTPAVEDGDRVTVTVLAVKGGERVVVAEKSGRV